MRQRCWGGDRVAAFLATARSLPTMLLVADPECESRLPVNFVTLWTGSTFHRCVSTDATRALDSEWFVVTARWRPVLLCARTLVRIRRAHSVWPMLELYYTIALCIAAATAADSDSRANVARPSHRTATAPPVDAAPWSLESSCHCSRPRLAAWWAMPRL